MTTSITSVQSQPSSLLRPNLRPILRPLLPVAAWSLLAALSFCVAGCGPLGQGGPAPENAAISADPGNDLTPAVTIAGKTITIAEVNAHMQDQFLKELLEQPEDKIFELRENAIRDLVQRHVIDEAAAERGVTAEALYEEITSVPPEPTAEDIALWYTANQSRLRGARLEDIESNIEQLLSTEAKQKAWGDFVSPKIAALDWEMAIEAPRQELAATRLIRGAADAPITIMSFSDYQCPYCIRSEPVLAEVLERFPESVRLIHRHFPLDNIHPFARPAAEAAMCADEQGKFWEYHDGIFARNGSLEEGSLDEIGNEIGLDLEAFKGCVGERRHQEFVQADFVAGQAAGVTGTPAFFVNGIAMKGARNADEISRVVESELARIQAN